jgi:hypothetical protein
MPLVIDGHGIKVAIKTLLNAKSILPGVIPLFLELLKPPMKTCQPSGLAAGSEAVDG